MREPAECPECSARLTRAGCPACGWKPKPVSSPGRRETADTTRCAWEAALGRCRMWGEYAPSVTGSGKWYCAWHAATIQQPRIITEFAEFERWMEIRGVKYCSAWHHFPIDALWDFVRGAPGEHRPAPCALPSCGIRLDHDIAEGPRRWPVREVVKRATHELPVPTPEQTSARKVIELERYRAHLGAKEERSE